MAITYSIEGGADAALFTIDPATGALKFKVAPDFEKPGDANKDNLYELTIGASDGVNKTLQSAKVTVKDVQENPTNLPPVFQSPATMTIDENIIAVATVLATDPEEQIPPIITPPGTVSGTLATVEVQDIAVFNGSSGVSGGDILPADRQTLWQPGVTYNGGIPNRTVIAATLSPSGGDDLAQIQTAINNCPDNQVVKLNAGTFKISGRILIGKSNITLRGAGPGTGCSGGVQAPSDGKGYSSVLQGNGTGTFIILQDRGGVGFNTCCLQINGASPNDVRAAVNFTADAALGTYSCTLASNPSLAVGDCVMVDQITTSEPDVNWTTYAMSGGPGTASNYAGRPNRSLGEFKRISAISGNTITFETPFRHAQKVANTAQLVAFDTPTVMWTGVEDLALMGGMSPASLVIARSAYCWAKHVECYYSNGPDQMYASYRCEFRDSYFHECPSPVNTGAGYRVSIVWYSSDCLIENCISWNGNKVITCQGVGGGNVVAYNYMDDAWATTYPDWTEAGVNVSHSTTPHMELVEGNWSHNFTADNYWGNEIDITVFRNWLTSLRGKRGWLNGWVSSSGVPYANYAIGAGRTTINCTSYSFRHNFIGNVLGVQNQNSTLLPADPRNAAQTPFVYEFINALPPNGGCSIYCIGAQQLGGDPWSFVPNTYQTQLRQGNWDWCTQSQIWYANPIGATGSTGNGTPQTIPDSLYIKTGRPAFFTSNSYGANTWPWVNPTNGACATLPAKARFDAGTPNLL